VACVYRGHYTATVLKTATMEAMKLLIVVSVTNSTNLAFHQSPHECLKIRSHSVRHVGTLRERILREFYTSDRSDGIQLFEIKR